MAVSHGGIQQLAWMNGDPLAVEGTTVAVDFNRIPRGSLIYIPSLDMFAEANDTGATTLWAQSDSGLSDYGTNGAGRIDIYNFAGGRSSGQVENNFESSVGNKEFGQIYIVSRGTGWKKGMPSDGHYEWRVRTTPTIGFELIHIPTGNAIATVNAYYRDPDEMNIRYANAAGFYWNRDSSVVALDELNRRRAGYLYFFVVQGGKAEMRRAEQFIPIPKTEEARLVVDPGWISPTTIRVRLVTRYGGSDTTSKFYIIDFSDPDAPQVQPGK